MRSGPSQDPLGKNNAQGMFVRFSPPPSLSHSSSPCKFGMLFCAIIRVNPFAVSHKVQILRKIACGEEDQLGDTSTLADPQVVDELIEAVHALRK